MLSGTVVQWYSVEQLHTCKYLTRKAIKRLYSGKAPGVLAEIYKARGLPMTERLTKWFCFGSMVLVFWCRRFCDVSPYVCSLWVSEWTPLKKKKQVLNRLTICYL